MKEAGKNWGNFSERLPQHKPERDLWAGIESGLDKVPSTPIDQRLPVHQPESKLWSAIAAALPVPWYSFRSVYFRITLGLALILLLLFFIADFRVNHSDTETTSLKPIIEKQIKENELLSKKQQNEFSNSPENDLEFEKDLNESTEKTDHAVIQADDKLIAQPIIQRQASSQRENILLSADSNVENKVQETEPAKTEFTKEVTAEESNIEANNSVTKKFPEINPHAIPARTSFGNPKLFNSAKQPLELSGSGSLLKSLRKEIFYEAGVFVQPSFIHNISTIDEDWHYSANFGFSLAMIANQLILETGLSYYKMEFEDKIEVDYYAFVFMGTLISTENYVLEDYVDEQGDSLVRRIYTVELIDIYDSTFVEEEKNDLVKLSGVTIPLTAGYRFSDNGRYFFDLKTGLDMMIVTGKIIPGNPTPTENIKMVDVQNSLADKYSVRWKYHLALGAGFMAGENLSVYAEPSLWWYPEGIRNKENNEIKNPFEAGFKFGLRWEF